MLGRNNPSPNPATPLPTSRQAKFGEAHSMAEPALKIAAPMDMVKILDILSESMPANKPDIVDVNRIILTRTSQQLLLSLERATYATTTP